MYVYTGREKGISDSLPTLPNPVTESEEGFRRPRLLLGTAVPVPVQYFPGPLIRPPSSSRSPPALPFYHPAAGETSSFPLAHSLGQVTGVINLTLQPFAS